MLVENTDLSPDYAIVYNSLARRRCINGSQLCTITEFSPINYKSQISNTLTGDRSLCLSDGFE